MDHYQPAVYLGLRPPLIVNKKLNRLLLILRRFFLLYCHSRGWVQEFLQVGHGGLKFGRFYQDHMALRMDS